MPDPLTSRRAVSVVGLAAAIALPLRQVLAAYPERPITWIVAYAADGGSDTLARLLAEAMAPRLGQSIVIENRPGGATNTGAAAARAKPDGRHTIFTADNGTLVFNPTLFKQLPRLEGLPDVPTVQEAPGLKDFEAFAWQGLVVPQATPDATIERFSAELAAALLQDPVRQRMRQIGLEPLTGGPAEMQRLAEAERAVWMPLRSSSRSASRWTEAWA